MYDIYTHSFITEIYIAPLQGYYSEALATLARLKRKSFGAGVKCVRKNPGAAIIAPKEAHSTQMGQPPRMHGLWRYEKRNKE